MTSVTACAPAQSFFLQGTAGDLFITYYPPLGATAHRRGVIFVPPFAEEMNKSRRMLALQARHLADLGLGVLMLDLHGTGDSQGDFAEARWTIWKQDIAVACAWLNQQGVRRISLLGLRLGGLLAMDFARQKDRSFERIVLWQPVLNGESMMMQFLRLRLAADMLASAEEKESTQSLRRILGGGESIEVAGYELASDLFAAIDGLRIEPMPTPDFPPIHWLELAPQDGRTLMPASQRVLQGWRDKGIDVNAAQVTGPAFWSSAEIALAPQLLQATSQIFRETAVQ